MCNLAIKMLHGVGEIGFLILILPFVFIKKYKIYIKFLRFFCVEFSNLEDKHNFSSALISYS